jgi:preprotein translocase subunit YajC
MEAAVQFLPLVALFAIFYFLVIRPQQQQVKKHKEMVDGLQKGDKIVTQGGFVVKIIKVEEEFLTVTFDAIGIPELPIKLDRGFIARKVD